MPRIDSRTVLALAADQQQDWIDEEASCRIADGAAAAVAAVAAELETLAPGPLTADPAEFLELLESLAGPP